jgi:hypothetical protein
VAFVFDVEPDGRQRLFQPGTDEGGAVGGHGSTFLNGRTVTRLYTPASM